MNQKQLKESIDALEEGNKEHFDNLVKEQLINEARKRTFDSQKSSENEEKLEEGAVTTTILTLFALAAGAVEYRINEYQN